MEVSQLSENKKFCVRTDCFLKKMPAFYLLNFWNSLEMIKVKDQTQREKAAVIL